MCLGLVSLMFCFYSSFSLSTSIFFLSVETRRDWKSNYFSTMDYYIILQCFSLQIFDNLLSQSYWIQITNLFYLYCFLSSQLKCFFICFMFSLNSTLARCFHLNVKFFLRYYCFDVILYFGRTTVKQNCPTFKECNIVEKIAFYLMGLNMFSLSNVSYFFSL